MPANVLLIERPGLDALTLEDLRDAVSGDASVTLVANRAEFVAAVASRPWDVVVAGMDVPGIHAGQVYAWLRQGGFGCPLVVVTDEPDLPEAVALVRRGASDVVVRRERWRLSLAVSRALVESAVRAPSPTPAPDEGWLRLVVDQLADGIVVIDGGGRIAWMNATARGLFGLEGALTTGLDARMLLPMGWRELADGAPTDVLTRRADGSSLPLEVRLRHAPFGDENLYVGSLRDVTERRALERQLQQAQRLEAVADLASGVAHEFNNVLTGVLTYASLLARELGPTHPSAGDVAAIEAAGDRAAALVKQLLILSRRQAVALKRVDVDRVVRDAAGFLTRALGPQVEIELALSGGLPPVFADPGQLEQVLTNLVVNARDAMPEGGRVRLSTLPRLEREPRRGLMPVSAGSYVLIVVEDTGSGMDADTLHRIFDPFFTTKTQGQGSGLGLPVVHGIVRQHGGFVEVESERGRGTRVVVALPVDAGGAPTTTSDAQGTLPGGTEIVLLAEDDDTVRAVVERILANHGYQVVSARDGAEALHLFQEDPSRFDAAVVDVLMPRMGGVDLFHALDALRPGLPVLWVSGFAGGNQVVLSPHTDFLPKPFNPNELVRRLRSLLDRGGA